MSDEPRMLPRLDADNRFFWTSGADGVLRFLQCRDCMAFVHPPCPICRACQSENVMPAVVAGTGIIDSYTINHQEWHSGLGAPYIIARVAIDGAPGVYLTTNIIGCPVEAVAIGERVGVTFLRQDDVFLPLFEKLG
jgi:uncharacterized protein